MATIITVYKNGTAMEIHDFDLASYQKNGWSTSKTATPAPTTTAPKTTTPTSSTPAPSGLNTVGLPEAYARKVAGTATATDLANLKYAESKGWKPPTTSTPTPTTAPKTTTPAPTPTPTPTPTTAPSTLNTAGLAEAAARRTAGTANATDLANLKYAESQGWKAPTTSTPSSTPAPAANAATTPTPAPASSLNTAGLIEAYARKQAGTANATDLANLEYAMGKGWTPPTATPSASTGSGAGSTPTGTTEQNIPGLNTNGLSEAYARKVAGTANATDLANLAYAESKGWKPASSTSSPVTDAKTANDLINSEQDADMNAKSDSDEPTVRSTTEEVMNYIKDQVKPEGDKPAAPEFEKSLTDLRTEYGLTPLETSLNDLQKEQADLSAEYAKLFGKERNKTVSMGVIEGRIGEEERAMNERMTALDNRIQNVTNQINTKYSIVNAIMDTKKLDYNAAAQAYDAQMQENVSLFNAAQGIQENLKSEAQKAIDSARSSAQIMVNGFSTAGLTFDELSSTQQTTLRKLALQSGFDEGFYEKLLSVTKEVQKDILTQIISDDKAYATIIYKDGTTATIPTGQPRGSNVPAGGSGGSTSTADKEYQKFLNDAANLVEKLDGGDISWSTAWDQLHIKYPDASPELIDSKLGGGRARTNDAGETVDLSGNKVDVNDQGYYGRGTVTAKK